MEYFYEKYNIYSRYKYLNEIKGNLKSEKKGGKFLE